MRKNEMNKNAIRIPEGKFCGGNCSDCRYYEWHTKRDDGRCWCGRRNSWYRPSERNGCADYVKE